MKRSLVLVSLVIGLGCAVLLLALVGGVRAMNPAASAAAFSNIILRNDSWDPGDSVSFQGIFAAEEMAAARLIVPGAEPAQLLAVHFLLGGESGTVTVTLHIWDDSGGTTAPGTELYGNDYSITASNGILQSIDLSAANITVNGAFRVGVEFHSDGLPATASDDDGLTASRNFAYSGGWMTAESMSLPGDWIIQATISADSPETEGLANDGWSPGGSVSFEAGFVAGEIPAARLVPPGTDTLSLTAIQFLWGGATGSVTVTLHIWDDAPLMLAPGTEIFSDDYFIIAADDQLQTISLSSENLSLSGPIRVGIEVHTSGLPSIGKDADGLTPNRNFVYLGGWQTSESALQNGDWIIRAVVAEPEFDLFLPLVSR